MLISNKIFSKHKYNLVGKFRRVPEGRILVVAAFNQTVDIVLTVAVDSYLSLDSDNNLFSPDIVEYARITSTEVSTSTTDHLRKYAQHREFRWKTLIN